MNKFIYFILLLLFCFSAKSQVQRPTANPAPNSPTGYSLIGFSRADSGFIWGRRDTFPAKYPTTVWHPNGNFYKTTGNGAAWTVFITSTAGTVTNVMANNPISVTNATTTPIISLDTTFSASGVTTRDRTKQQIDSVTAAIANAYVPYTGAVASVNLGEFRLSSRSVATDSILARSSAGGRIVSNSGTSIATYGAGGGSEFVFNGFAGYNANRSSSYTARSFVDKNALDSTALARLPIVNVKSYGAVGNGISDDWAAVLAAATYAEQNGLTLYFPSGTYNTSGSFTQSFTRTNTTSFSVLFGDNVKIKVIDTTNFDVPTNRRLFGYFTGTVPHSFTMTGGNVEIDGNNMLNVAITTSQTTNNNLAFSINCASLKIKNLTANSYANGDVHAIYTAGTYPLMEIKNVIVDSVSRAASLNLTNATQAILVASQLGKTVIDNVTVKNIGSTSLTQDCDGIVVRGIIGGSFDFVGGDFTIQNSYILNSRGRAIKAQSSNVKVYNTRIEQSDLQTFNSVNSIDFQVGNGIVDGCTFVYGAGTLGSSFASIAFQERVRYIDLYSRATNNIVLTKAQLDQFAVVISSATNSASADILIENNTVIPYDTTITSVLSRGFIEFTANNLMAMPPSSKWSFTIKNNTVNTSAYLLTYTGYSSGDISNKLKFDISGNKNYSKGLAVFEPISGSRINSVKKYRLKNNSGFSNYLPVWNVDFTRGAMMPDNEFSVGISTSTFVSAPSNFPTNSVAVIQVGDSSGQGQMRRVIVSDSLFHAYTYTDTWVNQPTAASLFLTNSVAAATYKAIADTFFANGYTTRVRLKQYGDSLAATKQNVLTNPVTGTGANGRIAYWATSSSIQSTANLSFDAAELRLLVGSTYGSLPDGTGAAFNPTINATTSSGVAGIGVLVNDGTNNRRAGLFVDQTNAVWGLSSSNSSGAIPFVLRVAGAERLRATTSGNIGINTLGANARLEVAASSGEVFRADAAGGAFRIIANQTGVSTQGAFSHTGTATVSSSITAGSLIRSGGTSSQFLKADGSVDNNTYLTSASITGKLNISDTSSMLGNYRRTTTKITNSDLANSTISGVALGGNLNNHLNGYGISGTAYNGALNQTWLVDTSAISTKANVTGALVAKLNISDTATMLAPFVQYSDTANILSKVVRTFSNQNITGAKTYNPDASSSVFYGNSVTVGQMSSNDSLRYSTQLATLLQTTEINKGISGTYMQFRTTGDSSMYERARTIPTYNASYKYLFFSYGVNDSRNFAECDTASFRADYYSVLDTAIAKGWPLSKIKLLTPTYWNDNPAYQYRNLDYVNVTKSIGSIRGVQAIDTYTSFVQFGTGSLMNADSIHPNDAGHTFIAKTIFGALAQYDADENGQTFNTPAYYNSIVKMNNLPITGGSDSLLYVNNGVIKKAPTNNVYLPLTGGSMRGSIDMDNSSITDVNQLIADTVLFNKQITVGFDYANLLTNSTANRTAQLIQNLVGSYTIGLEGSVGGQLASGTGAYDAVIGSDISRKLHFVTNGVSQGYFEHYGALNLNKSLLADSLKAKSSSGIAVYNNSGTKVAEFGASGGTNTTLSGSVTATSLIKSGGTSSQYLMADGSVRTNVTSSIDTGRAVSQIVTGGSLNKVRDSVVNLISAVATGASYTPDITGVTNVSGTPALIYATYTKVGNIVTVFVNCSVTATTEGNTALSITLPFTPTTGTFTVTGSADDSGGTYSVAYSAATSSTVTVKFPANGGGGKNLGITFNYLAN